MPATSPIEVTCSSNKAVRSSICACRASSASLDSTLHRLLQTLVLLIPSALWVSGVEEINLTAVRLRSRGASADLE